MRTFVVGDIHGCSKAFDLVLSASGFRSEDRLVTLGDYVDRGPNSRGVLDRLISLHSAGQLIALRGNHEFMMLHARDGEVPEAILLSYGGAETLASYGASGDVLGNLKAVPPEHWHFIENMCVAYWENETHFFVHANAEPHLPLSEQDESTLLWQRFGRPTPHYSGKIMVCGHTSQKSGLPINLGHAICLDTKAYEEGWLSCLELESGSIWQANQKGEQRQLWLADLLQP